MLRRTKSSPFKKGELSAKLTERIDAVKRR